MTSFERMVATLGNRRAVANARDAVEQRWVDQLTAERVCRRATGAGAALCAPPARR